MFKLVLILVMLQITSCATFKEHNRPKPFPEGSMKISIEKLSGGDRSILGYSEISGNTCKIFLRNYPECLLHEVRHCFEGNWHVGRETNEYC